jgi:glycosyltransferase involved in cell wall biosynthesis
VYGDVDINLIDGSSIWLVSLCSVLDRLDIQGNVLLKSNVKRDVLSRELGDLSHFRVWQPSDVGIDGRIRPGELVDALSAVDEAEGLDVIIVRGSRAAGAVAASGRFNRRMWPYLTDIPQTPEEMTPDRHAELSEILSASGRVLCQTESLRSFLVSYFPNHDDKMILLPPMVPDSAFEVGRDEPGSGPLRLFYAGKFAPLWGIEEMIEAVETVRLTSPEVMITVAGDKIHDPPDDPAYRQRVEAALESEGVDWLGGIDRGQVFTALENADLALSVRRRELNASREISTKLLEYAAAGVPAIVNRTLAHQDLLGDGYPLFVDDLDEVAGRITDVVSDPTVLESARSNLARIAAPYSMGASAERLRPALERSMIWRNSDLAGRRIVVAGDDLKFASELINGLRAAGADVRLDVWWARTEHDDELSLELVQWADIVLCEWCLPNAVWYSQHKRSGQRLIVRFHRTELNSPWPAQVEMDAVDEMVFVGDHIRAEAVERFRWEGRQLTVIPNLVDTIAFDRVKLPGAEYNLGMLGFLPKLKRLDRALDILEDLRVSDSRYRLILKGALPWQLGWVWRDSEQRENFEHLFERIRTSRLLRNAVAFDRAGGDVPSWFRKIGFILSLSDIESFHLAMIEGMISRSVPIVSNRPGAAAIIDERWIVEDDAEAATGIREVTAQRLQTLGAEANAEAVSRYNLEATADAWLRILTSGS